MQLPTSWHSVLADELAAPYFRDLTRFVADERARYTVYPREEDVFAAFHATPFDQVRVVLLGQDPYHDAGQAHGLCFSVPRGIKAPPSLVNVFSELSADLGVPPAPHGCLDGWARQGVLLLNTVLTVRAHKPMSHRGRGWETFTDAVLRALNERPAPAVFLLWGKPAQRKRALLDAHRHTILEAAHPSPLSARNGFFGSRPFSRANDALRARGQAPIEWQLSDE
jgi:uracil-DNA glycosylase